MPYQTFSARSHILRRASMARIPAAASSFKAPSAPASKRPSSVAASRVPSEATSPMAALLSAWGLSENKVAAARAVSSRVLTVASVSLPMALSRAVSAPGSGVWIRVAAAVRRAALSLEASVSEPLASLIARLMALLTLILTSSPLPAVPCPAPVIGSATASGSPVPEAIRIALSDWRQQRLPSASAASGRAASASPLPARSRTTASTCWKVPAPASLARLVLMLVSSAWTRPGMRRQAHRASMRKRHPRMAERNRRREGLRDSMPVPSSCPGRRTCRWRR